MASDRSDDFADDEYDDRPRRRPTDPGRGGAAVTGPAVGLIVVGAFALLLSGVNLIQALGGGLDAQLDAQRDAQIKQIDDNPAVPADQKQQQKDLMVQVYDAVKQVALPSTAAALLGGLVITLGGVQVLRLRSRGFGMAAAVLAMIPCFSSICCVAGIPVGIWALVVLGRPEVKAAFAASARAGDTLADDRDDIRG